MTRKSKQKDLITIDPKDLKFVFFDIASIKKRSANSRVLKLSRPPIKLSTSDEEILAKDGDPDQDQSDQPRNCIPGDLQVDLLTEDDLNEFRDRHKKEPPNPLNLLRVNESELRIVEFGEIAAPRAMKISPRVLKEYEELIADLRSHARLWTFDGGGEARDSDPDQDQSDQPWNCIPGDLQVDLLTEDDLNEFRDRYKKEPPNPLKLLRVNESELRIVEFGEITPRVMGITPLNQKKREELIANLRSHTKLSTSDSKGQSTENDPEAGPS